MDNYKILNTEKMVIIISQHVLYYFAIQFSLNIRSTKQKIF